MLLPRSGYRHDKALCSRLDVKRLLNNKIRTKQNKTKQNKQKKSNAKEKKRIEQKRKEKERKETKPNQTKPNQTNQPTNQSGSAAVCVVFTITNNLRSLKFAGGVL